MLPYEASCVDAHKAGLQNCSAHHNHTEHWWIQDMSVNSKCPRAIACPDRQSENEAKCGRLRRDCRG